MQTSSSKETVVYHARCECHEGTVTQVSIASCTSFFLQFFIKKLGQSLCGVIICELCWVHHCSLWPQPTERIASTDLIFSCSLFAFLSPVSRWVALLFPTFYKGGDIYHHIIIIHKINCSLNQWHWNVIRVDNDSQLWHSPYSKFIITLCVTHTWRRHGTRCSSSRAVCTHHTSQGGIPPHSALLLPITHTG